jgi:L-threonylcarbamoyladenylate synthase
MERLLADDDAIARAAKLLQDGGLVAFPTETVYGLGANALDADAVSRIYDAKGRPAHNPIIVHVADLQAARQAVAVWPDAAERLARRHWPGPLTLVLPKSAAVPAIVTAGLGSVGVRVPAHPIARALLTAAGVPVAAPSANRSNETSPTLPEHVLRSLSAAHGILLDGGPCAVGIESTVLDLSGDEPVLLRPGGISQQTLAADLGRPIARAQATHGDAARKAPGMLERHYAPRAKVLLAPHGDEPSLRAALAAASALGGKVGALAFAPLAGVDRMAVMPLDAARYAQRLYAELHAMDEAAVAAIVIMDAPPGADWDGVRDRLRRASS